MSLFKDVYRVESLRLPHRTYKENGKYFITINTRYRYPWFGTIRHNIVGLSDIGCIAAYYWQQIEKLRYYVHIDRWIVMPDHIHGIIQIHRNPIIDYTTQLTRWNAWSNTIHHVEIFHWKISTNQRIYQHVPKPYYRQQYPHSIGSIMKQFKSTCTKQIRKMGYNDFSWQSNYYEHIIRDTNALNAIRKYIINNPLGWEEEIDSPTNNVRPY